MFSLLKPYIFNLDPEIAHDLAIKSLKFNFIPKTFFEVDNEDLLEVEIFKKKFKNPIGLAAGFDKSAEVYNSLFKFGFGFIEVGTVTPRRQFGNPKPRIFRLEKDLALINRLGFNNDGLEIVKSRITNNTPKGTLGINIGPNKDTKNKGNDYIECLSRIHKYADYITINISSPNTEGLRDFHDKENFEELLSKINRYKKSKNIIKPIIVKISPDIKEKNISDIVELLIKHKVDGVIISNTTDKNRENIIGNNRIEKGGLSGAPLKDISTKLIKKFYYDLKNKIPIIGVGGIDSGESAFEKITAGASLVQLYTGMIYKGPTIVKEIKKELIEIFKREKIKNLKDIIGTNS
jgi:dihydroorotate dehydrogenase